MEIKTPCAGGVAMKMSHRRHRIHGINLHNHDSVMDTHLYDQDFYGWTQKQVALLKSGCLSELDTVHLIEEIEAMGRSERRELTWRLEVLLIHLLKWRYQPAFRSRSWQLTLIEQRRRISKLLAQNPGLKPELESCFHDAYDDARFGAMKETGIDISRFPLEPPMSLEQALDADYLPSDV